MALWEEPPHKRGLHCTSRRESLDRLQIVGVGSLRNLWRLVKYEATRTLVGRATVVHMEQPSQSVGQWIDTGAGRPKKEEQRLKPHHRYLD